MRTAKLAAVVAALAVGLPLSACGNNGNPTAGSTHDDAKDRSHQFASCMRDHGVDVDERTGAGGGDSGSGVGVLGKLEGQQVFDKAMESCRRYLPDGGDLAAPDPQRAARELDYAKCMRSNGVEDFPDPSADGVKSGHVIEIGPNVASDPDFSAADKKCETQLQGKDQPTR